VTTSPRLVRTATALIATLALAGCATGTTVTVEDPWVRSNPNGMGAVYMVLTMPEADELVAASVDPSIAGTVEVHEVIREDGMMRMREVAGIPFPGGEPVALEPGGYHIMLMDMPAVLDAGTDVDVTLSFASGEELTVTATVRASTMEDEMEMDHGDMGEGGMDHSDG
jgi:periplasmic copper chaperone A